MLGLVSLFPYVGPLAVVLAEFFLFQRMMGMWAAVTFSVVAVVLKKFSLFSVLKYFLASRSLSLELLSPYLERVSSNENSKDLFVHRLRQSQRQKHRYSGLLLGFGVFWLVLLSQPLVGPLFWGLAQGSAAVLLLEILQVERDARTHVNISASAYTS
jgi:predicted PurR-regulated permease PerM